MWLALHPCRGGTDCLTRDISRDRSPRDHSKHCTWSRTSLLKELPPADRHGTPARHLVEHIFAEANTVVTRHCGALARRRQRRHDPPSHLPAASYRLGLWMACQFWSSSHHGANRGCPAHLRHQPTAIASAPVDDPVRKPGEVVGNAHARVHSDEIPSSIAALFRVPVNDES